MKRRKNYEPKREKLWMLILRALVIVTVLVLAFAFGTREYLYQNVQRQALDQIQENTTRMQQYISRIQAETDPKWQMQEIRAKLLLYSIYDIMLDDPTGSGSENNPAIQIVPQYSENCHAVNSLIAEDGTIAASNQQALAVLLLFGKEKNNDGNRGFYFCDADVLHLPEVDALYKDLRELSGNAVLNKNTECYLELQMTSAYVNLETRSFIPHEGTIQLNRRNIDDSYLVEISQTEVLEERDIRIDLDLPGYELVDLARVANDDAYPKYMMFTFWGETQEEIDQYGNFFYPNMKSGWESGGFERSSTGKRIYYTNTPVYVGGKSYCLELRFRFDSDDPQILALWHRWILLFSGALVLIAALWVWRRQTLNRAKYAFEDMRRDLTDHLAHDIKTPLTAIGGYAENILDGKLSPEEQERYLHAILENVGFTDSLINRTLEFNRPGSKVKPEKLTVKPVLEEMLRKYTPLLDEKHITCTLDGDASLTADRAGLETILENLIANAVKYTPEGGQIRASADRKRIVLSNSVSGQIDVRHLKQPFVRGDAARSNPDGSGLGLALADRAALAAGWRLRLSCKDGLFRAEIRF